MPSSSALLIEFDDLSWIEVRDATQKIVYVGEFPKGTRQQVERAGAVSIVDRPGLGGARQLQRAFDRPQATHTRRCGAATD